MPHHLSRLARAWEVTGETSTTMKNIVGHEIYDLGVTVLEEDYRHTWRCCWLRTIAQAFYGIAIFAGILLIIWLAVGITGQIDASV